MNAAESIEHGVKVFKQEIADLRHSLHIEHANNADLKRELAKRPTEWAYQQACRALDHWRDEARRLAELAGVEPVQMPKSETK